MGPIGFLAFSFRRLESRAFPTLLLTLCIALTVGVMVCVPVFAGAVSRSIMREELAAKSKKLNRPLFTLRVYALPRVQQPMTLRDVAYARDWIANMVSRQVGLPMRSMYIESASPPLRMRPKPQDVHYTGEDIVSTRVVTVQDIEKHLQTVAGEPFGSGMNANALSVWVLPAFAARLGLQVGESYDLSYFFRAGDVPTTIKIAGFWQALDPAEGYWYADPATQFDAVLLTTPQGYETHIAPIVPEGTGAVFWYCVLDDSRMNFDRAQDYLKGLDIIGREVQQRLPRGAMDIAPSDELLLGRQRKNTLSLLLLGLSLPLMGILIFFIVSASTIVARYQLQETAILVSRGAGRMQVLLLMTLETLLILLFACPLGIFLGLRLAQLLGLSLSFLSFAPRPLLEVSLASVDWRLVGLAATIGFGARLAPTWMATRATIVTHERQVARHTVAHGAARLLLTACLTLVAWYAYRQLAQRGTLGMTGWQPWDDPARDPLLLLAPTLFVFTASLIAAEFFTVFVRPFAWIGRLLPSATAYLSGINLGREGGQYRAPTYMLVLALSMGVFYASLAKSADVWLVERLQYRVGADLTFAQGLPERMAASTPGTGWVLPVSEYQKIKGIASVTRIGEYQAAVPAAKGLPRLRLIGIDRESFPQVAYFRRDYASHALGELMNLLGATNSGLLISRSLATRLNLGEGDRLPLDVSIEDAWYRLDFDIVGTFEYFPTVYEKVGPAVIVNLKYLDREVGGVLPPGIWARLEAGAQGDAVLEDVLGLNVQPMAPHDLQQMLAQDQQRLERVGIFGLLSIAFLAGAFLSGANLLLYSSASLSGRAYRLAVLRALGMRPREIIGTISVEYVVTLLYGILAGTTLGLIGARLYVPFFPLTEDPALPIPPFVPLVDWQRAAWLAGVIGVTLLLAEALLLWRIARARMFEVLRLGVRS